MEIISKKSLASRIVFYVAAFCVLLFLISLSVFYFFSKKSIEEKTIENALEITQNTVLKTEQVLISSEKILNNYRWLIEKNIAYADSMEAYTRRILQMNPEIIGCAIAFKPDFFPEKGYYFSPFTYRNKDLLVSTQLGNEEYDYFVMDWYQIPATLEKPYWSEPYYDTGGGNALMTTYSMPFYSSNNGDKELAGIITIDLSLEWFTDIVSSVKILETGYASVISRNGTFVTHPNTDIIMNQTIFSFAAEMQSPGLRQIGRNMQAGKTGFEDVVVNGRDLIVSYKPLLTSNWTLAVVFSRDEMYAPLRQISLVLIFIIVIGMALMVFIVKKIVEQQIAPLKCFARSSIEIAEGNFNTELPDIKTEDEMKELHNAFVHMQTDLKKYIKNLKETTSAKEKIESELRIAREIQMGMIPKIFPPFPDTPEIDLYAMLEPAKEVGGDLYDFFMIDDTHLCYAIGDVSGKGVPASLFMAVTRTLLRSVAPKQRSTSEIVNNLNNSLAIGNESSMFVTFFIGIINLKTGEMNYTNAGHNPPIIIHADNKSEFFEITQDIPIGLFENYDYTEKTRVLSENDRLFLYTDGITEAENWDEELYSDERLIKCIRAINSLDPTEIVMKVARDVVVHVNDCQQSDDLTMMSIIYKGSKK
ncbi:MAG: SpoIIE family protein phosphatase [Prolixibacteraceae bacterium]|nr:SpoIIE family protein phosphatase [Prolixibacteraceae bacterium]MBN2650178.1 SpoIIE family protein phosphatase [Prolixibacteraceae bacterium]